MAVTRKPKPKSVEEFIDEGGSPPQRVTPATPPPQTEEGMEEVKGLKLRLPTSLLKRVDEVVALRRPSPSRHQWILEAIYEKLDRETEDSSD